MRIPRTIALVPAIFPIWFATMVASDDNDNNNNNDDYAGNDTEPIEATSPKRGLCYVSGEDPEDDRTWDHSDSDLSWYYNFQAHPIRGMDDKLQYVPMLWGEDSADDLDGSFFDVVKGHIDSGLDIEYVLGFNEPDGCEGGGSCIDPDKAAEVWIDQIEPLKDLGLNLGAPAVTGSPRGLRWLQDFYTECNGGCTTDFLPIHWYGNFEGMAAYIGQVNETYQNMSMWITEFNYPEQDLEETQAFFNQSINHLDELSFVTHYSWFGAFRSDESNVGPNGALLDSDGELTDMGSYYMGGSSTGKVPSSATVNAAFAGASVFVVAAVFWSFG